MPELLLWIRANSDSAKRLRFDLSAHEEASERFPSWPPGPLPHAWFRVCAHYLHNSPGTSDVSRAPTTPLEYRKTTETEQP